MVGNDNRIYLLTDDLDRGKATALQECCDAYLSLHRAEGFGYTIAETMLLGKPAIVTGYSGNTDFTNDQTAFLVSYDISGPVDPLTRCRWSVPDVEHAAWLMRKTYSDHEMALRIGSAGRDYLEQHHSLETVGKAIKEQLEWCYQNLRN
jgi:glycosyltransferase involved in cell wall biosynthesis